MEHGLEAEVSWGYNYKGLRNLNEIDSIIVGEHYYLIHIYLYNK